MANAVVCDSCQRCDEWMCGANGDVIVNSAGCTGACLYWRTHKIIHPGVIPPNDILDIFISERELESMERICENINEVFATSKIYNVTTILIRLHNTTYYFSRLLNTTHYYLILLTTTSGYSRLLITTCYYLLLLTST